MAVDWWLVNNADLPTLRFYNWDRPTFSLGYRQQFNLPGSAEPLFSRFPVVVRPTGGGYLLHAAEITYSLVIPASNSLASASIMEVYTLIREAFTRAARAYDYINHSNRGDGRENFVADCLARPGEHEPVQEGKKWLAAAQLRHEGKVLQHGSVFWDADAWPADISLQSPYFLTKNSTREEREHFWRVLVREVNTEFLTEGYGKIRELGSKEWAEIDQLSPEFSVEEPADLPVFRRHA